MNLGDARSGKLAHNMAAFGRTLRQAGIQVDSARIAMSAQAALLVGLSSKPDLSAALEAVLVSREQDRMVFRELFDAFFRDPQMAHKLLAQMLPSAEGQAPPSKLRPRVREALSPRSRTPQQAQPGKEDQKVDFDAAMTASAIARLRHADFNQLSAAEYRLVEGLARQIALPLPKFVGRRTQVGARGAQLHWSGVMRHAVRCGGEPLLLPRKQRRDEYAPLLLLVDVSGSMERYSRLLLAFMHAATRRHPRRDVFSFGTQLTDLTPYFKLADTDQMLTQAGAAIDDFAGGTQFGEALAQLRQRHARRFVGGRTVVLVVSDGLDTGEPAALGQELGWLKRHCRHLLWLNPLLRFDGYAPLARGAQQLHHHADAMLAVHNLERLEELAASLAALMQPGNRRVVRSIR
jgi:uncharacterized protein with von Willebrand factor type A (vWA) domain